MSAEQQIRVLRDYIMAEIPGEPSRGEGAGDTAVRVLKQYRHAFNRIMKELGSPGPGYAAPVSNAINIAKDTLEGARYPEGAVSGEAASAP